MNKVTYLIGAGASAEALPLAKSNPDYKIEGLSEALVRVADQLEMENEKDELKETVSKLKTNLYWLAENSKSFNTVDTFAKYCFLQEPEKFLLIKKLLSVYFTIDQTINKRLDNRYLVFLTTILENQFQFPNNIKILNWNYDCQLQLTSLRFKPEGVTFSAGIFMQTDPLINYFPSMGMYPMQMTKPKDSYSLVHLNGIAGYIENRENIVFNTLYDIKTIPEFLDHSINIIDKNFNLLTFAWESPKNMRYSSNIEIAKEIIIGSDILVIIGYSFPFFNREIDKEIFNVLCQTGLKKIYYQDKFKSGDFLRSQFDLERSIELLTIDKTDQLFIPIEL